MNFLIRLLTKFNEGLLAFILIEIHMYIKIFFCHIFSNPLSQKLMLHFEGFIEDNMKSLIIYAVLLIKTITHTK